MGVLRTKAVASSEETQRERDNREVSYRAALESVVVLENDGALPLAPGRVALYGAGARKTVKGGSGSGEVHERHSVNVAEGLEAAGFTITTNQWLDDYDREYRKGEDDFAAETAKRMRRLSFRVLGEVMADPYRYPYGRAITVDDVHASGTDTCVYVISRQAGEGGDRRLERDDYSLSRVERANIRTCAQSYARTIVVINVGSSFDATLMNEIPGVNALVYMSQLGMCGGTALADILRGAVNPSGKLTDSWAKRYEDVPFGYEFGYLNGDLDDEDYRDGIYVGYRYFDTFGVEPRYPFGHGLSYTSFDISYVDLAVTGTTATLNLRVENTGSVAGKQIAQVYVSCPDGALSKERQRLAGFAKTTALEPGASQELTIDIDLRQLTSYDAAAAQFVLEPGEYVVRAGSSSRDTVAYAVLALDDKVVVSTHTNICPPVKKVAELAAPDVPVPPTDTVGLPSVVVKASDFDSSTYQYADPPIHSDPDVDAMLAKLSVEDMIELVNGAGMIQVFLGGAFFNAPGVSGYTTSKLLDKGIINIALADGPAGLRLQRGTVVTKRGRLKQVEAMMDVLEFLPGIVRRFVFADPDKAKEVLHQYTTAFPVENALGQSWNTELVEEVGRAVGREMAEYGVTYWLAPGINIHRNPLTGRNFEYYSEDPLLAGKLAAAITRGVQSTDGCYVTIKHFIANEREEERTGSSSNVGERALREIYLRAYEIAVKEGAPKGIMTSYNRVNGVFTANSHDLCTKVLRNEWGFDGVVMTDWLSTEKGQGDSALCMHAGNDLIMPGSGYTRKTIKAGLESGTCTEQDLRRCAANILHGILHSRLAREISPKRRSTTPTVARAPGRTGRPLRR